MRTLVFLALVAAPMIAEAQSCPAGLSVGFRVATIAGVKTGMWYPTAAAESSFDYGGRASITGSVAANAPVASCGRFPLVVFSHGFGGCGGQSIAFTEELARRGYVVAAPDHKDAGCSVDGSAGGGLTRPEEPFRNPETWTSSTYDDRRDDVRNIISALLTSTDFGAAIDSASIGGAGHSLGGYTMFGLAGGWPGWKDPRIKAAVLLSPYLDPFLVKSKFPQFPQVDIPLMIQGGTTDSGVTPQIEAAGGAYDSASSPKFFAKFQGGHLLWSNATCNGMSVRQCLNSVSVMASVDNTAFDFFDRYLKIADRPALLSRTTSTVRPVYRRSTKATTVSGASYKPTGLATLSVGSLFAEGLSEKTEAAASFPLPQSLSGYSVTVQDSKGTKYPAPLYFVSRNQINFLLPGGVAAGPATVTVQDQTDVVASGPITVGAVAPALFSVGSDGTGTAAGLTVTVRPDGSRGQGFLFTPNLTAAPIDVRAGQVYLDLYGTGLRNATAARAAARVGNQSVPVLAIAPSPEYPGLDQIAVGPLPPTLAGAGTVEVQISIDGQAANTLTVSIQ